MRSLRSLNPEKFQEFKDELFNNCGLILIRIWYCSDTLDYFYEFGNLGYPKENFTISEFGKNTPTYEMLHKIEEYYDQLVTTNQMDTINET